MPICQSPQDYWKMKLSDKFRNERKSNAEDSLRNKSKIKKKTPSGRIMLESPPSGEEDVESISMHIKSMQEETKKKNQDVRKIGELMKVTFQHRRQELLSEKMLVTDVRMKYPFLFQTEQIHKEFERITGVASLPSIITNLRSFREEILKFPFKDKKSRELIEELKTRCTNQPSQEKVEEILEWAVALVPCLFKTVPTLIMGFQEEQNQKITSPYLIMEHNGSKNHLTVKKFYVVVEGERFGMAKTVTEGLSILISAYWIFDMKYPRETRDVYNFFETALLKLGNVKATRCVASIVAKLTSAK